MDELRHSKTSAKTQTELFNLIIDKNGYVIAFNPSVKKIIPEITPHKVLFEFFDEETVINLQRIFLDARKYETTGRDYVELKKGNEKLVYEFLFSPLKSENNIYFFVDIIPTEFTEIKQKVEKFYIATSKIEKICSDKKILSVINKIKITFPFTFIEKAKIQKEINELDEFFWIKDISGKFILVNDLYASSLGFSSAQLENKKEEDYLPKFLVSLYNTINNFIINSLNSVIIEGIETPVSSDYGKGVNIIQFPICDLENKVVAIIGFSQKEKDKVSEKEVISPLSILNIPYLFTNSNHIIESYNEQLISLLNIKVDIKNKTLMQILPENFVKPIHDYLYDNAKNEILSFDYSQPDEENINLEIIVQKIFVKNSFYGTLILFLKKNKESISLQSKSFFDILIHSYTEPVFVYDLENLKFIEVNDAALKLYGYRRNDFLNMDLTDLFAPEDIQGLIQSTDTKSTFTLAGPWRHKKSDGTSIFVSINRIAIEYKNKKAHLCIIRDITKELEGNKKLQLYQNLYENTSDLLILTDKDGFIIDINDNVPKKIGLSKKDLGARPLISLVSDEDRAKVNKNIFHSGLMKPITLEVNLKMQNGDFQKSSLIASPIKNYQGEIETYSIILKIIEEKSNNIQLQINKEEVTQIDSTFLSSLFHELLTPLNVIIGFTQDLSESISTPYIEQKEAMDIIKENQKVLMQIMDNAIEYSTLLQKSVKIKPEQI